MASREFQIYGYIRPSRSLCLQRDFPIAAQLQPKPAKGDPLPVALCDCGASATRKVERLMKSAAQPIDTEFTSNRALAYRGYLAVKLDQGLTVVHNR